VQNAKRIHTLTISSYDLSKYRLLNTEDLSEWQPVWKKRWPWSPEADGKYVWRRAPERENAGDA
jgi:hypothetical protein